MHAENETKKKMFLFGMVNLLEPSEIHVYKLSLKRFVQNRKFDSLVFLIKLKTEIRDSMFEDPNFYHPENPQL